MPTAMRNNEVAEALPLKLEIPLKNIMLLNAEVS